MKRRLIAGTINRYYPEPGWVNVHIDISDRGIWDAQLNHVVQPEFVGSIAEMPMFEDGEFDEIRCHHVLEHLHPDWANQAMREAWRVLKPGGVYDVEVPDADRIARAWCAGEIVLWEMAQWMLGEQLPNHEPGDSHRALFTEASLRERLSAAGFEPGESLPTGLAVRFRAEKVT